MPKIYAMHMLNLMSYNHINQYALLHKFFCVNKTADNSFSTFYYYFSAPDAMQFVVFQSFYS